MQHWWHQLTPWLELARWLTESPDCNQLENRGRKIEYGVWTEPKYLVRSAYLDGELTLAGHSAPFVGKATDLTLPGQYGAVDLDRPTRLKLITKGPFTAELYAQLDRINGTARQQIAMRCDDLPVPGRTWGSSDDLCLSIAPSRVQVQAQLTLSEGHINGRMRVTQHSLELSARASADTIPPMLVEPLNDAARQIKQINLAIEIAGAWNSPQLQFHSDFGTELQTHLHSAAQEVVDRAREALLAQADHQLQDILHQSQLQLETEQVILQQQLDTAREVLAGLAEPVASRLQPLQGLLRKF
jgi:hypothetical protein